MDAYKRLSRAASFDELDAVVRDLTDAYEAPPEETRALIDLTELRIAASSLEVRRLKLDGPDLIFTTDQPQRLDPLLKSAAGRASVIDAKTVYYRPPANYLDPPETLLAVLRKLLVQPMRQRAAGA
jgi:transcription-repair coupling factor (superfamily II helicase)